MFIGVYLIEDHG